MKIAIQGHPTRGKEVIQILESLDGVNECLLKGNTVSTYYYIDYDFNNTIHCHNMKYVNKCCKKYTLEEFEKEFPFKVGDLCRYYSPICGEIVVKILGLFLKSDSIVYEVDNKDSTKAHSFIYKEKHLLKPYKEMKEERNITLTLDKAKEWYKKDGELKEIALQAFSEKELNLYPRSWEEFCDMHSKRTDNEYFIEENSDICKANAAFSRLLDSDKNLCPSKESAEAHLAMIQLEQLRDCWWGDWKPDWLKGNVQKYVIQKWRDRCSIETAYVTHSFLSFPTYEMAKEFLECFRDLIEKAGDLI